MSIEIKREKCYNNPIRCRNVGGIVVDRITNSLMNQFKSDFELNIPEDNKLFEYFSNYSVASNENGVDNLNIEDMMTGNSNPGIDGIAIVVNGKYIYSEADIDELIRINKTLRVKFIFVQCKTSESFNNGDMLNFFHFTNVFFSGDAGSFASEEMRHFIDLKNYIFNKSPKLERNPELVMYYCTCGSWQENSDISSTINLTKANLLGLNLFSKVDIKMCGADAMQKFYRKTFGSLECTFTFEKRVTMYSVSESEIGYCGVLPFSEFKKIMLDGSGSLKPVFEDNIRDFLGTNIDVNRDIENTLKEGNVNSFSMLNNGVMIVANSSHLSGDIMTIRDYQIVNGCQTCHMLYEHMEDMEHIDNLMIPIRIISTQDENLKNRITRATNNQTGIKKEQLEALSTFQKNLEEYYKTYTKSDNQLFYERRSGQYRDSEITKSRIINIPTQIKTVSAMFLNNPHGVSGQYGTIAKNVGNKIFKPGDKNIIYYTAAMALYRIESLMKTGAIDKKYRKARYHAMMILRIVISGKEMPRFNAKDMEAYCKKIVDILNDSHECQRYFTEIINYFVNHMNLDMNDRKTFERKETTDLILSKADDIARVIRHA